ncbi:MAG TPA: leucyl aminopeptidase [Alphaproteobacteria bacterium]
MHIKFTTANQTSKPVLAVPVSKGKKMPAAIRKLLPAGLVTQLDKIAKSAAAFEGEKDQFLWAHHVKNGTAISSVLLYGIGDEASFDAIQDSQKTGGQLFVNLNAYGTKDATIMMAPVMDAAQCALGAKLRAYHFDNYKTKDKEKALPKLKSLAFATEAAKQAQKDWASLDGIANAVYLARDLMNQPPNICTPANFVKTARATMKDLPVKFTVLNEDKIHALGMGAIEAVGRGSRNASHVLIAEYNGLGTAAKGKAKSKPIALVGKGVTFDTGGYNLKPGSSPFGMMGDMKYDMGGAAAVIGALMALANAGVKQHVVAIVGLVENLIDEDAYLPGEVITTMSGQTVEIVDTDAEGRLVLADLLTHVQKEYDPSVIIDIATLTGAILIALGQNYAGLFSNDDKLADGLFKAGQEIGEKCWRLPLDAATPATLKSSIADLVNVEPSRLGGASFAASFIHQFVDKDRAWAHLDIAGLMKANGSNPICPAGAMGYGVRLLYQYVVDNATNG